MKRHYDEKGLTLIEVIFAVGILSVGLIAILSLFPAGLKMSQQATYTSRATILAQSIIEEIRLHAASGESLSTIKGKYEITNRTALPEDGRFEYEINWNSTGISDLHEIEVKLFWPICAQKQRENLFVTYLYKP